MMGKFTGKPYIIFDGKNHGFRLSGFDFPNKTNPVK